MRDPVFLDTVGLIAVWEETDKWHPGASDVFERLIAERSEFYTTSYVFAEVANTAARKPYRPDANELREALESNGCLIHPTENEWQEAWEAYARGEAGSAGLVDHLSFVVMRRLGIHRVFSNDRHFAAAGFQVLF